MLPNKIIFLTVFVRKFIFIFALNSTIIFTLLIVFKYIYSFILFGNFILFEHLDKCRQLFRSLNKKFRVSKYINYEIGPPLGRIRYIQELLDLKRPSHPLSLFLSIYFFKIRFLLLN